MSDSTYSPVPRGVSNTGAAVVFGPTTDGLGALRYLQSVDKMEAAQRARAQAAAQKTKEAQDKDLLNRSQFKPAEAGVHFLPWLEQYSQETAKRMQTIATDRSRPWSERAWDIEQEKRKHDDLYMASRVADKALGDELQKYRTDDRYNAAATSQLLTDSLYRRNEDGSLKVGADGKPELYPPNEWDARAAVAAISKGNAHLNTPALFEKFVDTLPEDSVTYSQQPLSGGRGYKRVAKSNVFELAEDGTIRVDPRTGKRVLKNTPELLAAFMSDPLQKQWLLAEDEKHEQQLAGIVEKMRNYQPLSGEEQHTVDTEQSTDGRWLELVKRGLVQYGYGRQQTDLLAKAAPKSPAAKAPKFTRAGGLEFGPELTGGTAAGGTHGLLALASSDPLVRVKADGSHTPFTAKATHRQYVLLQNGQPAKLVTNNAVPQTLSYTKPQLYLTTPTGNVFTPKDPTLLQRFANGDKQPLLNWVRAAREEHPGYALKWHFQAVPATDKLTVQNQAQEIYGRLLEERTKAGLAAGQPGYRTDDELQNTAQKLASQQGATLLIPYTSSDMRDINRATDFLLKGPERQKAMQAQFDYFNSQTAPRPAEQRATPKKSLGINFGTPPPAAAPVPTAAPSTPTFKRAGSKKTGIQF